MRRLVALSSTIMTGMPERSGIGAPSAPDADAGATPVRIVKWKVVPRRSALSTQMRPPIISTSFFEIVSPRPVPP